MASDSDAPVDLYIAAYADPDAARGDWDAIKQLAKDDVIKVDGLVLVSRRTTERSTSMTTSTRSARAPSGARSEGAVVGLIFPPSLLAGAAVGAGLGAGAGGLLSHAEKKEIKADVEDTLPLNSSGIVAIFEERWADDIAKALPNASKVTKEKVDKDSADQVKAAATKNVPPLSQSPEMFRGAPDVRTVGGHDDLI